MDPTAVRERRRALILLASAELLAMSPWFSASAAVPALRAEWHLSDSGAAWLTLAVQFGFVAGTLASALANLPDIIRVRTVLAASAIGAAISNASIGWFANGIEAAVGLRFLTGFFLAGVYPPGMKLMATWYRSGRGMAIGVLVGALTLGKASPYLINAVGSADWRTNEMLISLAALLGGLVVLLLVSEGPYAEPLARFDIRQAGAVFSDRGLRLANFGYFGHMWELYAMWAWAPAMIRAGVAQSGGSPFLSELASFLVIGAGAVGCIGAGLLADRIGRTLVTSGAMIISGSCCLVIGLFFDSNPVLLIVLAVVWGVSVVADSAQFSACVTELGDRRYIGTALTLQTCIGFLLTTVSLRLIPVLEAAAGWRYAFMSLAPGPALGVVAMLRLRSLPESARIAQGKR
ncbi:MAG: MFS transporter [Acidobacteria bacterium]|nr:MFS transporter [Acidobacteriota bacterium]